MPTSLVCALLGWLIGVGAQLQQLTLDDVIDYQRILALGLAVAAASRLLHARSQGRALGRWAQRALVLVATAGLGWGVTGWHACHIQRQVLDPALQGQDLVVTGVVADLPQRFEQGQRLRLEVNHAQDEHGAIVALPPVLALTWYAIGWDEQPLPSRLGPPDDLQPGQRWRLQVRLKLPHGGFNPHGFDYELWMWEQGLRAQGYVRNGKRDEPPQLLAPASGVDIDGWRWQIRQRITQHVPDASSAGVLAALVVGDQNAISRTDWDVFRATGVAHLVAISGLHITMFAWLAQHLLGAIWRRSAALCMRWSAVSAGLWGGWLLSLAYARFSGWGVPAQRTIIMLTVVTLLRWLGVRWPWRITWLLACAVVLAADPWAALQPGFWLSFVAVGVLFATDLGAASAGLTGVRGRLVGMLREQAVITVALTPLTVLLFGQVAVVGLLANLIAIPAITLLVTPLAMAGVVWPDAWSLSATLVQQLMLVLQAMASWPWANLWVAQAPLSLALLACVGGLLLVLRLPWNFRVLAVPLVVPALLWQRAPPPAGEVELLAADVGQGSAIVLRTAGHALLYDAGPRYSPETDAGGRVLVPLLSAMGWRLDGVVLSHRDSDHTGGATAVLGQQRGAWVLASDLTAVPSRSLNPTGRCQTGLRWDWDGVRFAVLHPPAFEGEVPARKTNASSCVLHIQTRSASLLLPGDLEQPQEAQLVRSGAVPHADLLVLAHHGSKNATSAEWLDAVQPRVALAQAGYRNSYGHPAPAVVERLRERGVTVLDSPHCGAVQWASVNPQATLCERQRAPRYWHHRID